MFKYRTGSSSASENEYDDEFNTYFLNIFKSQKPTFNLPPLDIIKEEFLISKGLKQRKKVLEEEKIKWDITYQENEDGYKKYLKCRYDEVYKVNVLVQNTFDIDVGNATEKILDCARLFHSNDKPIIIIQNHNDGGYGKLSVLMHQTFQIRNPGRLYESHRITNMTKKYYSKSEFKYTDIETCKTINLFDEFKETTDYYNYNNLSIEHKRTKVYDFIDKEFRNGMNNFREEYFNSSNLKKPTDIIIFTDSYTYSAGSILIREFQNTGGAIIVGYYGNPSKNGTDFFDASQSFSVVETLKSLDVYENLNDLGYTILGVTTGEFYDDYYQKENPIPMEYTLDEVDYRVDIYSRYSDDIYDKFIKEGLEIHNLFNNGSYCNSKNDRLHLHDNKCFIIEGDMHLHGGYKCNNESKWDEG